MTQAPTDLKTVFVAAGSASELARKLSISPPAVLQWRHVPAGRVLAVEDITGISRHHLRPDIFGPTPNEAAE
ncbi:CI repressor [Rhizobium sp. Leaf384]|uniref:transcriptional regulator n=1 Tax=unclassified Rhizobium TaxID=2613769 RepID=UPI0007133B59|nr:MULTISPECIES: YdaS family helix-turn-helix protein [unclassified Rhizobium]KQS76831.1 CI repressor [Rhizobium sp. Leaf384]KQS78102.1 CI repressor [Rhizobium sp. Leaf383]